MGYKGLQEVIRGYRELKGLKKVRGGDILLQAATGGYRGLEWVTDLGIILDSNLTFNEHVNTLTSSLFSILCQISRVRHLFSKSVLTTILNCLVFL